MKGKAGSALSLWLCAVEGGPSQLTASSMSKAGLGEGKAKGEPNQRETAQTVPVCPNRPTSVPACKFVNVEPLSGAENGIRNPYKVPFKITVFLENPVGANTLNYHGLVQEVRRADELSYNVTLTT